LTKKSEYHQIEETRPHRFPSVVCRVQLIPVSVGNYRLQNVTSTVEINVKLFTTPTPG